MNPWTPPEKRYRNCQGSNAIPRPDKAYLRGAILIYFIVIHLAFYHWHTTTNASLISARQSFLAFAFRRAQQSVFLFQYDMLPNPHHVGHFGYCWQRETLQVLSVRDPAYPSLPYSIAAQDACSTTGLNATGYAPWQTSSPDFSDHAFR